jgi:sugar phosphate permease
MNTSRRAERKAAARQARRRRLLSLLGGAVIVALAIVVALIVINRPNNSGLPPIQPAAETHPNIPTSGRTMGNQSAPVTVVEWGDYQ